MTRDQARWFVLGAVTALVLCLTLAWQREVALTADIQRKDAQIDSGKKDVARLTAANTVLAQAQAEHNANADRASAAAEKIANTLGARVVVLPVSAIPQPTVIGDADGNARFVPLTDFLVVKSAWEAERTARLHYEEERVPGIEAELTALRGLSALQDSSIVLWKQRIGQLERRQKLYLYGGITLGVTAVIAVRLIVP